MYETKEKIREACSVRAAANITAYMTRFQKDYSNLYTYPNFSKSNFKLHMYNRYDYLSPYYIPVANVPLGIWPMGKFEKGVEKYAKEKGVKFNGIHDNSKFNKKNIINYITNGLKADAPVAMLIGVNNKMQDITVKQPNGTSWVQSSFATHWVVITELTVDRIKDTAKVKVSTWGGYSYLDLDSYLEGETIYECLLYFQ